ncbi:MAG TPA: DegV family protein [Tissierellia bacterium]|jgi:DegV family protein with EDD domain|nr:DegV family protein [Tissierellia bacterium]
MIKLIVDSTCDLNNEITDNYDIEIIPLSITVDGKSYLDGVDIDTDEVYKYMKEGKIPKTSQVSFESVSKVIEKCISNNWDFIYLAFSSKLSGTYNFAKKIIEKYKEKYPERKMAIIDSKGGAGGNGLIVMQAIKMIERNLPFEYIIKQIQFMVQHIVYRFTITDLEWLSKGGRISKTAGYVGNVLNIKPYLIVEDGLIKVLKMIRGSKKTIQKLLMDTEEGTAKFNNQIIGISHADDLETALLLEKKIRDRVKGCKTTIFKIGAVLGTHLGIGGVGVFFFDEKPEFYEF